MNALEQEYADNVARAARRETTRVVALIAVAVGVGASAATVVALLTNDAAPIFVGLIVATAGIANAYFRHATRTVPSRPIDDEPVQIEHGYRDAPVPTASRRASARRTTLVTIGSYGALVLMMGCGLLFALDPLGHFSGRLFAALGMLLVVTAQRVHAAWKRRHDAKLMLEWERRLEEMK